jgi:5'-nucleotidase
MKILISNDDGYQSPGIEVLAAALGKFATVIVIAPDRDRSGASNSLTLENPIRARNHQNGFISVNGTPTDCVHVAITGLLDEEPDMVVAGINNGSNMGDDVLYSGTVAAATEGRFLGLPAMAVSIDSFSPRHLDSAARAAVQLVRRLSDPALNREMILNVNVPDLPWEQIRGYRATRLGHRHKAEPVFRERDPRGNPIYWVGPPGAEQDAGVGTDFHAVRNGFISVTPLKVDLTNHQQLQQTSAWLQEL